MNTHSLVAALLVVLSAAGCDDGGTGSNGSAGTGGTAASGGHGGSGDPECDELELLCSVLDEAECALLTQDEGCYPVRGAAYEGDLETCLEQPREFLGCRAGCLGAPQAPYCIYHPSDPQSCFCLSDGSVLTGWEGLFECDVPSGLCGLSSARDPEASSAARYGTEAD